MHIFGINKLIQLNKAPSLMCKCVALLKTMAQKHEQEVHQQDEWILWDAYVVV